MTLNLPESVEKEPEYKYSSYKFYNDENNERKEQPREHEVVLKITSDFGLENYEIRDFKVADKK